MNERFRPHPAAARRRRTATAVRRCAGAVTLAAALAACSANTPTATSSSAATSAADATTTSVGSSGATTPTPPTTAIAMLNLLGSAGLNWAPPNGTPQDRTSSIDNTTDAGKNETSLAVGRTANARILTFGFTTPATRAAAQAGILADPDQVGDAGATDITCGPILIVVAPVSDATKTAASTDVAAVKTAVAALRCPS